MRWRKRKVFKPLFKRKNRGFWPGLLYVKRVVKRKDAWWHSIFDLGLAIGWIRFVRMLGGIMVGILKILNIGIMIIGLFFMRKPFQSMIEYINQNLKKK